MHLPSLFALCIYFVVVCHFFFLSSTWQIVAVVVVAVAVAVGLTIIHRHFFISCLVCFGLVSGVKPN